MDGAEDRRAIEDVIEHQFRSIGWSDGAGPDASGFAEDFHSDARLYPAARPVSPTTVEAFLERMRHLAGSSLRNFHERVVGSRIHVFGNVAVAFVAGEATENERDLSRMVEAILLVREGGRWKIVAQAWDAETEDRPLPEDLAGPS